MRQPATAIAFTAPDGGDRAAQLVQLDVDQNGHVDAELEGLAGARLDIEGVLGDRMDVQLSTTSLSTRISMGSLTAACRSSLVGVTVPPAMLTSRSAVRALAGRRAVRRA